MTVLAFDIGGANIKVSDGLSFCHCQDFALWRHKDQLRQRLAGIVAESPPCETVAATMTGELADCYLDKQEGVLHIIQSLVAATGDRPVFCYLSDGRLVGADEVLPNPLLAAASNWHVLASYSKRFVGKRDGLLVDVGSTTCDVIPFFNGEVAAKGYDDTSRLQNGELVYTGVERSPVSAIVDSICVAGAETPVAQELFATTLDAYLLLGDIVEDESKLDTADGRGRTKTNAARRLARMSFLADLSEIANTDLLAAATKIAERQTNLLIIAVQEVLSGIGIPCRVLISGHGQFLAKRALDSIATARSIERIYLTDRVGEMAARCAPAYALAVLARERLAR